MVTATRGLHRPTRNTRRIESGRNHAKLPPLRNESSSRRFRARAGGGGPRVPRLPLRTTARAAFAWRLHRQGDRGGRAHLVNFPDGRRARRCNEGLRDRIEDDHRPFPPVGTEDGAVRERRE
jgi:hypothetical protein